MIYHVSPRGSDAHSGTKEAPLRTISRAAHLAAPGDTVQVHSGEYREWVSPVRGGLNDQCRIVYEAAPGEHPVIKGSEIAKEWVHIKGTVWKTIVPNAVFGEWNPYAQRVEGDWMRQPEEYSVHLGDVYINGVSMFEASSWEDLLEAPVRTTCCQNRSRLDTEWILHPEQTPYRWYAQVDDDVTTIWGNFHKLNPNEETIEINVRKCCFYPLQTGVNYITVRGFEMAHAACPFAPPTAEQFGLIGPHWSRGWIIENNDIHDAKCSGISLGKETSTGENEAFFFGRKSGHRYQMEAVFKALQAGWCREKIGSHIVRNNFIHDCGQTGIVGHMGAAFSRIEHNHICNISVKREFWGHELGGIKLHAAIDAVLENNHIHHCTYGTWLDWQAQGARVTRSLYHHNSCDLMIEVTHGPCMVDHNLLLSPAALNNHAQGTALVHNLISGCVWPLKVPERSTPYHFPHSTQVAGVMETYGGDDRIFNNLFLGIQEPQGRYEAFTQYCDAFTAPEEYTGQLNSGGKYLALKTYASIPQPVWVDGNIYAGLAQPCRMETTPVRADMQAELEEQDGEWFLMLTVSEEAANSACAPVTTQRLSMPRIVEEPYENPDGTPIDFELDYHRHRREGAVCPGPFARVIYGTQRLSVWKA